MYSRNALNGSVTPANIIKQSKLGVSLKLLSDGDRTTIGKSTKVFLRIYKRLSTIKSTLGSY